MATSITLQESINDGGLNLEKFVREATWKDLLIDLVKRNKLDPWNIDLIEIVDKYINAIKVMKILDLHVPANIILAASMLLRMKSEMIDFGDRIEEQEEMPAAERPIVSVDSLVPRFRVAPKRKMQLAELITALEEAMKLKEQHELRAERDANIQLPVMITGVDIEEEMESVYEIVKNKVGKDKMITFTELSRTANISDVLLGIFVPLLFLASKSRIIMLQETFFGEIIVMLNG
ncbi:MAG: segregation/condensation protein A [Candidatus Micrarchaeia archaeon]